MRSRSLTIAAASLIALAVPTLAPAQEEPTGQKTLAATVGLYVFPTDGQASPQQSKDEAECYAWAVDNTKSDPFDLAKRAEQEKSDSQAAKQQVAQSGQGAGAAGAIKGAAVGALIGEIASNDAGGGAAWGAAAGLVASKRRVRRGQAQATQQIESTSQQKQQATAEQIEGFKKAFSVCLEAKKYMVRF